MQKTDKVRHILLPTADLCEYAPGFRTLQFGIRKYCLFLPWVVFLLNRRNTPQYLQVGFRTKPVDDNNLDNETLLLPPLPNTFDKLMVCCKPDISEFWLSSFSPANYYIESILLSHTDLKSYQHWSTLKPEEVMRIFENWPTTPYFYGEGFIQTRYVISDLI